MKRNRAVKTSPSSPLPVASAPATQTSSVAGTSTAVYASHLSCRRSIPVARRKRTRTAWTPATRPASMPRNASGQSTSEHPGEPWQRPVHVLVGRLEGLAVEEAQDEKGRYGRGGGERNAPPPWRGQPAIWEDERDRDQHREQKRPGRLIPEHRPFRARESAGLLLQGVRRVGLRDGESREQKGIREQQPADRVTGPTHRHQQTNSGRGEHHRGAEHPLPRRLSVRARQRVQHRPEHAERHGDGRENPGPRGGPAHGTIVSRGGPTATALPLKRVRW